jgi:hypothetical protein
VQVVLMTLRSCFALWGSFLSVIALVGCLGGEQKDQGCSSNRDCRGSQVCSAARCVALETADAGSTEDDSHAEVTDDGIESFIPRPIETSSDDESSDTEAMSSDEAPTSDEGVTTEEESSLEPSSMEPSSGDQTADDTVVTEVSVVVDIDAGVEPCPGDCDDGVECTIDSCVMGLCAHDDSACECSADEDCADPEAAACVAFSCDTNRTCVVDSAACPCSVDEDCADADPCTEQACVRNACFSSILVGSPCDDGLSCTTPDLCQADGSCAGDEAACINVPAAWTCSSLFFADERCDCGCGAQDIDCNGASALDCDVCNALGSCATTCADISPTDNAVCESLPEVPAGWTCNTAWYVDEECDCGCGVVDADCADDSAAACEYCACPGAVDCSTVSPLNNAQCGAEWVCDVVSFDDGVSCDCGCGAWDPDCASAAAGACDNCDNLGSCSDTACSNLLPGSNAVCEASAEWTCDPSWWGDLDCDCGCGVVDIDCASSLPEACDFCGLSGSCATSDCAELNPEDNSICVVDPNWTCDPALQGDGLLCNCGCGSFDPDCASALAEACDSCDIGSCADEACVGLDPSDNAICVAPPP